MAVWAKAAAQAKVEKAEEEARLAAKATKAAAVAQAAAKAQREAAEEQWLMEAAATLASTPSQQRRQG